MATITIKAFWTLSYSDGELDIDLDDLGCRTLKQWEKLPEEVKNQRIFQRLQEDTEMPSKVLLDYEVTEED